MLDDQGLERWYTALRTHGIPPSSVTYRNRRCPRCQMPCLERTSYGEGHRFYSDYPVEYDGPHRCPAETLQIQTLKERIAHLERALDYESNDSPETRVSRGPTFEQETIPARDSNHLSETASSRKPPLRPTTGYQRYRPATSPPDDDDRIIGVSYDSE